MFGLILLIIALATPFPPAGPCDFPATLHRDGHGQNLPPGNTSTDTEIVHATAVLYKDGLTGWLYETRRGEVFYQDGPIGSAPNYTRASSTAALYALAEFGFLNPDTANLQKGTIGQVKQKVAPFGADLTFKGCY
ncbi:MAG: hypothetical protein JO104_00660 [Candidatus Eremiobacteraeota bacterium]|nr:hypothetical protein [Candidatus Eremiobacteraeota bacterium]MBV8529800.1 hypothetical protein [Candidatus Eremiobacteraeota bacterium]